MNAETEVTQDANNLFSEKEIAEVDKLRAVYLKTQNASYEAALTYFIATMKLRKLLNKLHARLPKPATSTEPVAKQPKPEQLFDISFVPPKRKVVRALAEDENSACDLATDLFQTGIRIDKPDRKRRAVFAWRQRNSRSMVRATRVKAPKRQTRAVVS